MKEILIEHRELRKGSKNGIRRKKEYGIHIIRLILLEKEKRKTSFPRKNRK